MFFYVQILALSFSDSLLRTKTRKAAFGGPPPTPTQIQPGTDATSLAPADFTGLPLPVGCLCRAQVLEASWGLALPKVARWGRPPARSPCPEPISWAASLGRSRPARCSVPAVETVPKEGFPDAETPPSPAASQLSESLCFLETRPRPVAGVDGLVRRGLAGGRSAGRLGTCRGCAGSLEPPAAGGGSRDRGQPGAEGPQRPPISSDSAAPSSPPPFLLSLLQLLLPTLLLLLLLLLAIRRCLLPVPPARLRDAGAQGALHRARSGRREQGSRPGGRPGMAVK